MNISEVLEEVRRGGIMLQADADRLHVNAPKGALTPELRQALLEHKPALLRLLATPTPPACGGQDDHQHDHLERPCPRCGVSDWRETPDGGRWCQPCVLAGRDMVAAVKVHSAVLDAEIWVVADDLPREAWPTDAPVYMQAEVKILRQLGSDVLAWVHATKTMLGAKAVDGKRRPAPTPVPLGKAPEQE